jgi:hypothetical protein
MYVVYRFLAVALAGFFGAVVWMGFRAVPGTPTAGTHIAAAFFLVICLLFLHSLCIFYLIGSGRDIRMAVVEKSWASPYLGAINRLRLRAFPWALASMALGIIAAWSGAGTHTRLWSPMSHRVVAVVALAVNLLALYVEYVQLRANSRMIADVNARLHAEDASSPSESPQTATPA